VRLRFGSERLRVLPRSGLVQLGTVAGVTLALGSVSLVYPFGRDQGIYGLLARTVLQGQTLYRDVLAGVPPMTVLTHLLAQLLFGSSMTALRLLDLLWTAATAGFVYLFFARAFGRSWQAVTAGVLYSFLYYTLDFWNSAQVDGFLNLPVAAAFALAATALASRRSARNTGWQWFGAGLLVGAAVFFKYSILALVPALAVLALVVPEGRKRWNWRAALVFVSGSACLCIIVLGLLGASGALGGFLEPWLRYGAGYVRVGSAATGPLGALGQLLDRCLLHPDLGIGAVLGLPGLFASILLFVRGRKGTRQRLRMGLVAVWAWLGVAALAVLVQGKLFTYHYLPLLPPLAVLATFGLALLLEPAVGSLRRDWQRRLLLAGLAFAILASTSYPSRFKDLLRVASGAEFAPHFWKRDLHETGDFSFGEQMVVADYIRDFSGPADRVLVWGVDPLINFLADRRSVTRFPYNHVLISDWAWEGHRAEFLRDLTGHPPELLVVTHEDATPWQTGRDEDSFEAMMGLAPLRQFVTANYELEIQIGRFDVLRRIGADSAAEASLRGSALLAEDLEEAVGYVQHLDTGRFRVVAWPGWDSRQTAELHALSRPETVIEQSELNRYFWLNRGDVDALMPALSIWVRFDERPFARLSPFSYQNDAEHFEADYYRFTLLHTCQNGRVLVFAVEASPGAEEPG